MKVTIFQILHWSGMALGVLAGLALGFRFFGPLGALLCALAGFVVGSVIGTLPDWISTKSFVKELEKKSVDELKEILAEEEWNFRQTLALLNLAARGEDVQGELPRIREMLRSDSQAERTYGWDALRLVYPPETKRIGDYNPKESTNDCRRKAARLQPRD